MKASRQVITRFYLSLTDQLLQHKRRFLVMLALFALFLRLAYIGTFVGFNSPPEYDGIGYSQLAEGLLAGKGYVNYWGEPTAFRPPVYPLLLAGIYVVSGHSLAAVRISQAILDVITCLLVYAVAVQTVGFRAAVLSALGVMFYPWLIYETGLLIPETLSYTLQFAAVWCLVLMQGRHRLALSGIAGILMALTVLARPTAALWVPLICLGIVFLPGFSSKRFERLAILLTGLGLVLIPWTIRNYLRLGALIPISSLSAVNIWSGNNAFAEGGCVFPSAVTWEGLDPPTRGWHGWAGISEAESNQRFAEAGWQWIRTHPRQSIALIPKKLLRLWSPVSYSTQSGRQPTLLMMILAIPPYLVLLGLAGYGIFLTRHQWRELYPLLTLILSINILVVIYFGGTRYGIPMAVVLIIFAAVALDRILQQTGPT